MTAHELREALRAAAAAGDPEAAAFLPTFDAWMRPTASPTEPGPIFRHIGLDRVLVSA